MRNVFSECTFISLKVQFYSLFMKKRIVPVVMSEAAFEEKLLQEGVINEPIKRVQFDDKVNERKRKMQEVVRKYDQTVTMHK